MLFNSLPFALFFVIVYGLYLVLPHKWQNRMLLVASCVFYGSWDWRFLFLMFSLISVDYVCALRIHASDNETTRKKLVSLSIAVNLLALGFFKYFNFFASNFQELLLRFGMSLQVNIFHILLPLGISFYTFEAMSYVIDVYRKKIEPAKGYLDYALFVTYFPHLVAGPIMRAKDLLPQIALPRKLSLAQFYEGSYLVFWGLFQKIFIADNLAKIVDPIFNAPPPYNALQIIVAGYAFAFQVYCDFAGYSDIARGLGKLMGFEIMLNFNLPFFATNPQDFWNRWHISLSTWVKDYIYIPLFLSLRALKTNLRLYAALILSMLLLGLWHGAAWHFIVMGLYWGVVLVLYALSKPVFQDWFKFNNQALEKIWFWIRVVFMFHITVIGMVIFRVRSLTQAYAIVHALMFNLKFNHLIDIRHDLISMLGFIWVLVTVQLAQFINGDLMVVYKRGTIVKAVFYITCYLLLVIYGAASGKDFIYFQF